MRRRPMFRFVLAFALGFLALVTSATFAQAQTPSTARVVPASLRIRAFGDGVTAGFGADSSGALLPITDAMDCRPQWIGDGSATTAGTRCSSNGANGPGSPVDEVSFNADFGLRNQVSWAAQVASQLNAVDFANYAVTGSTLASWLNLPHDDNAPAEGAQHDLLERIERDDPDIVLASIGGDLLLQQPAGAVRTCATLSNRDAQTQQFIDCVNSLLDRQMTKQRIMAIAFDVLAHTQNAKLIFATYAPAEPLLSALLPWQQVQLAEVVNAQIRAAVAAVAESGATWAQRIEILSWASQVDRCPPVVIEGPRFFGRNWLTYASICGNSATRLAEGPGLFTPVSLGTIPQGFLQTELAKSAVNAIHAHAWA